VHFIRRAADALFELVNDLLDLAKAEAGKLVVRPVEFTVENLFGALRGMLRPLLSGIPSPSCSRIRRASRRSTRTREGLADPPQLHLERAQVHRARRGARVGAPVDEGGAVEFVVADTGIGIAPEDQERIFQEFTQIDSPLQRQVKGTGLGLPLTRKLASLLADGSAS
jgi:signal transduction histidine kinase